ncbi:hypothetical protein XSR1_10270 [Xenorhabdus szentirmaii DSM 16338]|uniref:Uncharacterized protein n=1 Tax=Xenorhabdus szentirmaii DSM 16338 TaxID=1427518 RepID=W1IQR4_9GAMM|nr:hypothetical protein XSR1_10270 [Xenorhabdus szentirmaii DSM 16338]
MVGVGGSSPLGRTKYQVDTAKYHVRP